MSEPLAPEPMNPASSSRRWWRGLTVGVAAAVLVGAGVGIGMATGASGATTEGAGMSMPGMSSTGTPTPGTAHKRKGHQGKAPAKPVDPARQAWAHKYGVDRSTMPNLAPVADATLEQKQAALGLLEATEQATAKYSDVAVAKAAGFDIERSLAAAEKRHPKLADAIKRMDAGKQMPRMPMLHVGNPANRRDGKVLDPQAPETLMYEYQGHGAWKLIGVMYVANESYPSAPPDPGGPITRWHYHDKHGGQSLMMHLFFLPGNDLARAYAAEMT